MTNSFSENPFQSFLKIRLKKAEKRAIREEIVQFMELNPIPTITSVQEEAEENETSEKSLEVGVLLRNLFAPFTPLVTRPALAAWLIAIVVTAATGTGFVAQASIPGDLLYSYKLNVNERLLVWMAISQESEAELALNLAEKRLEEAELLAARGNLNSENRDYLQTQFEAHVGDGYDQLQTNAEVTSERIAANFEATLKGHQAVMKDISSKSDEGTAKEVTILVNVVKGEIESSGEVKDKSTASLQASPEIKQAAQGKQLAAQNKLNSTSHFYEIQKGDITLSSQKTIEIEMKRVNELIAEGQALLKAGNFSEAFALFQTALQASQEVNVLVKASVKLPEITSGAAEANETNENESIAPKMNLDIQSEVEIKVNTNSNLPAETETNVQVDVF